VVEPRRPGHRQRRRRQFRHHPPRRDAAGRAAIGHARDLLREAGHPEGFDVRMDGFNVALREHVCQAIAAMPTQVGIRSELHPSPGTQFFPMITQAKVSLAEFGFTTEDAWQGPNGLLHTRDANGGGTFNGGRHSNPRLDALIDAIPTEPDAGRRHALIAEALKLAADDIADVPPYRRTLSWAMQKKVQVVVLPDDALPVRWVHVR